MPETGSTLDEARVELLGRFCESDVCALNWIDIPDGTASDIRAFMDPYKGLPCLYCGDVVEDCAVGTWDGVTFRSLWTGTYGNYVICRHATRFALINLPEPPQESSNA